MDTQNICKKSRLFAGIDAQSLSHILGCLNAHTRKLVHGNTLLARGDSLSHLFVVIEGVLHITKLDFEGNEYVIRQVHAGQTIAAAACFSTQRVAPYDVVCVKNAQVLCLDILKLLQPCTHACGFHLSLVQNLMREIADQTQFLADRIEVLTMRTIEEKVLTMLRSVSELQGSKSIVLDMNRELMAKYLAVSRPALSRELARLQEQGKIKFKGKEFVLL